MNITSHPPTQEQSKPHPSGPLAFASDVLALSHIFNGMSSAAAVAIGYLAMVWYAGLAINGGAFVSAVLATMCLSNGGFIVNDIFDLEIDRINRPDRPLAAGRVSITVGWILYGLYTVIGIILAALNGLTLGLLGTLIALGLFFYSYDLKKRFLIGHIIIGTFGALLLPFGGLAAGSPVLFLTFPITFSAFFGREVLKTVPDAEGDRANGVDNITTRYGIQAAVRVTQVTLIICALALPLLKLFWNLNNWYLGAALVVIWPVTALLITRLSKPDPDGKHVHFVLRITKLMFLLVAAAILIGTFR